MKKLEFNNLINKDKYQVFVFVCPSSLPISFGLHPWFVVNKKGTITRYEVLFRKNCCGESIGHLHINFLSPWQGLDIIPFLRMFYWKSALLGHIDGDENSIAKRMADFIENSKENYPYLYTYSFLGPNSNTYAQHILNKFPEANIKLPWNCFGKNYKK